MTRAPLPAGPCAAGLLAAALLAALSVATTSVRAADHADSPRASADPMADITDIFAWMSPDATRVHLVMGIGRDVAVDARFSDAVQYVFRITSQPAYAVGGAPDARTNIVCTFTPQQIVTCHVGGVTVTGDASNPAGIGDPDGRVRLFTGVRNDAFYFNGSGFRETARQVTAALPDLPRDAAGCPTLDEATARALRTQLRTEPDGSAAQDNFGGFNVLAIVLSVDKTLLTAGGPILGVAGSTHVRPMPGATP